MNENNISQEYESYLEGIQELFKHGETITLSTYQKIVRPEHFFKKYQGIGISLTELETMIKNGIKIIRIIYKNHQNETTTYITTPREYLNKGITYIYKEDDTQKILPIKEMIRG